MRKLNFVDRYLSIWILLAMIIGLTISYLFPSFTNESTSLSINQVNIPLAAGLVIMLYPPLVKVDFEKLPVVFSNVPKLLLSIILNWVLGPLFMYLLAIALLPDYPPYITGLILIGIARCIAMVLVWNELANGDTQYAAGLVALNSLFQLICYPAYAWFFSSILPSWLGINYEPLRVSFSDIALSVAIYLGIPFTIAYLTRRIAIPVKGELWFQNSFLPKINPLTLIALLFTVTIMFSLQGSQIIKHPIEVIRISIPLCLYFIGMFFGGYFLSKITDASKAERIAIAFTAAGNNFELAIAVAVATFGISSPEALATIVGPLIEVPVLLLMVNWVRRFAQ